MIRAPFNLSTRGRSVGVVRTFEERGSTGNLAIARADHKERPRNASGKGQPRNATSGNPRRAAYGSVLRYTSVSRVRATAAARWLKIPCLEYFDDLGAIAT